MIFVQACGLGVVTGFCVNEGVLRALEFCIERTKQAYEKSVETLQKQYITSLQEDPSVSGENKNILLEQPLGLYAEGIFCPHYPDCDSTTQTNSLTDCQRKRLAIREHKNEYIHSYGIINPKNMNLITVMTLIMGIATAALSVYALAPLGAALKLKVTIGVVGGFSGFIAAGYSASSRINFNLI